MENLIAVIDDNKYQFKSKEKLFDFLLSNRNMKYSEMTEEKKKEVRFLKAYINAFGDENNVINFQELLNVKYKDVKDIEGKYIIDNDETYLNSLLMNNKLILLEKKEAGIFIGENEIDRANYKEYAVLNLFAHENLNKYLKEKMQEKKEVVETKQEQEKESEER